MYEIICSKFLRVKDVKITQNGHPPTRIMQTFAQKNAIINLKHKHIKKYGIYYNNLTSLQKGKITNLKKYGVDNVFKMTDNIKKSNIKKFGKEYHFQQHLSDDTLSKLKDKEWLHKMNHVYKRSCVDIAEMLDVDNTTVNKAMYRLGMIPQHTYTSSHNEKKIAEFLRDNDVIVEENNRNIITPLELDIYMPEYNIAIEYCGLYWHNELNKNKDSHKIKYDRCKELGIKLLTIYEDEWIDDKQLIKEMILHRLGKNSTRKIYARHCEIFEVSTKDKKDFFNKTHIQGNGPSSINVGLYNNGELIACMGFIRSKENLILNRFSSKYRIPGGFSKILSYVKKNIHFKKITTFADLRWTSGEVYETTGFVLDSILDPDYYYVYKNKRYHKFNFRHEKLKRILKEYDPNKSEHENCLNNNIFRIYDCGKKRYVLTSK